MAQNFLGRIVVDGLNEFGRMPGETGYGGIVEGVVTVIVDVPVATATALAPVAAPAISHIVNAPVALASALAPAGDAFTFVPIDAPVALASAFAPVGSTWGGLNVLAPIALASALAPAASVQITPAPPPYPFALQLYATATGLPITTLYEFSSLSYSRGENEAAQVSITFPAGHPANKAIRDIYTAEPHGIYGILYRRGVAWCGVTLAETDVTASPVAWSFLGFEALLREHKTPWNWHGLENLTILQAITAICEKGLRWWQVNGAAGLAAATLSDCEVKTWAQLSGGSEGFNQSMIILSKHGASPHYMDSGTAVFAFDFAAQLPLERIRWKASLGEYVALAAQYRYSADNSTWSEWTAAVSVADAEYAETYGITAAGTGRYVEVKFTLSTEDVTTKDPDGNAVGTSPVLFGVEVITSYDTGIDAYSISVADENLPIGFDFSHENHLAALASICEDYGYAFRIDHAKRLYVWTPGSSSPVVVKRGETCEPTTISYRGLDSIENVLTCYGAGEGLGRLSTIIEDTDSIGIYGRRPGVFEDSKLTNLTDLTASGNAEIALRAWPLLECQIKAPYEPGRGVLDAKLHDLVKYIDAEAWTGSDELGSQTFEITSEQREWTPGGEVVQLGLNSDLDNYFVKQAKKAKKHGKYKHGRSVGQTPFDVRAVGGFAQVQLYWHGSAPEYIVEVSANGTTGWASVARTADRTYIHSQLASATAYYYRVRAVYQGAISGPSAVISATTTTITAGDFDTTAPGVPADLNVTTGTALTTGGGIVILNTLTWTANSEADLASYEVQRSINESSWIIVGIIPAGLQSYVDTQGLVEATTYYYQIRAVDKTGNRSAWSASDSVLTAADAGAPTVPATAPSILVGQKMLAVIMAGSTDADLAYYELQRAEAAATLSGSTHLYEVPASPDWGAFATITGSAIRGNKYTDNDVAYNKCYKYKYRAVDTSGNASSYSNESAAAVPSQTLASDIAANSITADRYHELRQNLCYTWETYAGNAATFEKEFWVPEEATDIIASLITIKAQFTSTPYPAGVLLYLDEGEGYGDSIELEAPPDDNVWYVMADSVEMGVASGGVKKIKIGWTVGQNFPCDLRVMVIIKADISA